MLGSDDDFSKDELALIPPPEADEAEAMQQESAQAAPTAAVGSEPTAEAPAPVEAPAAPAPEPSPAPAPAVAAPAPEPQGDVRAALRAARRGEHRAIERANRAEAELAELRAKVPQAPNPDEITDADIADMERDFPAAAKVARVTRAQQRAAAAAPTPAPAPEPASQEFVPPVLPLAVQEAVDSTPDLLAWQNSQDQTLFKAAVEADGYFQSLPAWKDKPIAERFAAVVERVKQDAGISSPAPTPARADPAAVIAQVPRTTPSTLSDIAGGGGAPQTQASNLERFAKMSEEQILADLARE